jgi:hypothetical protein
MLSPSHVSTILDSITIEFVARGCQLGAYLSQLKGLNFPIFNDNKIKAPSHIHKEFFAHHLNITLRRSRLAEKK